MYDNRDTHYFGKYQGRLATTEEEKMMEATLPYIALLSDNNFGPSLSTRISMSFMNIANHRMGDSALDLWVNDNDFLILRPDKRIATDTRPEICLYASDDTLIQFALIRT